MPPSETWHDGCRSYRRIGGVYKAVTPTLTPQAPIPPSVFAGQHTVLTLASCADPVAR